MPSFALRVSSTGSLDADGPHTEEPAQNADHNPIGADHQHFPSKKCPLEL